MRPQTPIWTCTAKALRLSQTAPPRKISVTAMAAHYPFHPTFIEFLNQKLATVETFQGTRGVLRVLALALRSLWREKHARPCGAVCSGSRRRLTALTLMTSLSPMTSI